MKNASGLVAISALITVFACSSKDSTPGASDAAVDTGTTGNVRDASRDRNIPDEDAGATPASDAGVLADNTIGNICTTDPDCEKNAAEPTGAEDKVCFKGAPTPVCIGACTYVSGGVSACDNSRGFCLPAGNNGGVCLPGCRWSFAAPDGGAETVTGCQGKNKCEVFGFTQAPGTGAPNGGLGTCTGGCTADADCATGQKCQISIGLCVATADHKPIQDTTPAATACSGRTNPTPACACEAPTTGPGLCALTCVTGPNGNTGANPGQCPTGTACAAGLPKINAGTPLFTSTPNGLAGTCRRICDPAANGDTTCENGTPNAGFCSTNDALVDGTTIRGLCAPGRRPAGPG